jgi:hypothetical protein
MLARFQAVAHGQFFIPPSFLLWQASYFPPCPSFWSGLAAEEVKGGVIFSHGHPSRGREPFSMACVIATWICSMGSSPGMISAAS